MSEINTGGPAFPTYRVNMHGEVVPDEEGMTLRDYFAAKAMQALVSSPNCENTFNATQKAKAAYAIADEMLKAREQ